MALLALPGPGNVRRRWCRFRVYGGVLAIGALAWLEAITWQDIPWRADPSRSFLHCQVITYAPPLATLPNLGSDHSSIPAAAHTIAIVWLIQHMFY